jgi:hypothetical protein
MDLVFRMGVLSDGTWLSDGTKTSTFARFRRHQMRAPSQILGAPNTQANPRAPAKNTIVSQLSLRLLSSTCVSTLPLFSKEKGNNQASSAPGPDRGSSTIPMSIVRPPSAPVLCITLTSGGKRPGIERCPSRWLAIVSSSQRVDSSDRPALRRHIRASSRASSPGAAWSRSPSASNAISASRSALCETPAPLL